ncbi:MAG: hypothetical protein WC152_08330, partial [Candidatus Izemoplasmatales bacterium]
MRLILEVFLEKVPKGFSVKKIEEELSKEEYVRNIHHIHLWSIEGNVPIATLHARLSHKVSIEEAAKITINLKKRLKDLNILHSTIQIEFFDDQCDNFECEDIEINSTHQGHHH